MWNVLSGSTRFRSKEYQINVFRSESIVRLGQSESVRDEKLEFSSQHPFPICRTFVSSFRAPGLGSRITEAARTTSAHARLYCIDTICIFFT